MYYRGGVWLGGCGRGNTGTPSQLLEEGPEDSEAGPEGLQGLEWWSSGAGRTGRAGRAPVPTLRARSVLRPSLVQDPLGMPSLANKGEI